jgi:hypothetical protein
VNDLYKTGTYPWICDRCGETFVTYRWGVSCLVEHFGSCCHYNDRRVTGPVKEDVV